VFLSGTGSPKRAAGGRANCNVPLLVAISSLCAFTLLGTGIICHDPQSQTKATPSPTLSKLQSKHVIWRDEKYLSLAVASAGWWTAQHVFA